MDYIAWLTVYEICVLLGFVDILQRDLPQSRLHVDPQTTQQELRMIWIHLNVACISGTWFYQGMYDFEGCHGLFLLKPSPVLLL